MPAEIGPSETVVLPVEAVASLGYLAKLPNMEQRLDRATRARLDAQARVMKALAHPTRLFIVEELSRGERCVCELTEEKP